jgi:hypothetical protein
MGPSAGAGSVGNVELASVRNAARRMAFASARFQKVQSLLQLTGKAPRDRYRFKSAIELTWVLQCKFLRDRVAQHFLELGLAGVRRQVASNATAYKSSQPGPSIPRPPQELLQADERSMNSAAIVRAASASVARYIDSGAFFLSQYLSCTAVSCGPTPCPLY